jgi:hypothetical protein
MGAKVAVLVAAAGLLLAAACGGDDDDGGADDESFCQEAVAFLGSGAFDEDPRSEAAVEATERAAEANPPDELAEDWERLIEGARVLAEMDPDDLPLEDEMPPEIQSLGPASSNVFNYLAENCEEDLG